MPRMVLNFTLNGEPTELLVQPHHTLLEAVRDVARLTGTKEGCSTGDCGACTVQLDGKAVASCLVLAMQARGRTVRTVEGLASPDTLHPVQAAFVEHDGMQCGYCTPGMVMSCAALLDRNPNPAADDVKQAISGNICRCGTYPKVVEAVLATARSRKGA